MSAIVAHPISAQARAAIRQILSEPFDSSEARQTQTRAKEVQARFAKIARYRSRKFGSPGTSEAAM